MENQTNWIEDQWGLVGVHDPTIIKDRTKYYMFSTDTKLEGQLTVGGQIRMSTDLQHWRYLQTALSGVPMPAKAWSNATGLWAPEIKKIGQKFMMYYSASTFGSRTSCIGLATADHAIGPWHDQGLVIKTNGHQNGQNAIDANLVIDRQKRSWLVYGSFFGGIYIVEIDAQTGFTKKQDDQGTRIVQRPAEIGDGAVEGCYIQYQPEQDYYYLFMSYDSLTWSYNVRVARSREITGPYLDFMDQSVIYPRGGNYDQIGTKILGSYQFNDHYAWIAPGHNSIFNDDNMQLMVHHVRKEPNQEESYGFIRKVYYLKNGWPVVSPNFYHRDEKIMNNKLIERRTGEEIWWTTSSEVILGQFITIDRTFLNSLDDYIVINSYDWEKKEWYNYLLGMTHSGTSCWVRLNR
ncbi:arabinan endo-1,5-alpha-L-arabinosidase [Lapidilactobacillus dextrinicus]|uniref:arabinan endo-1,5-alpha-L-arabinosidase n=1 Tax=Lapidilactobacillus dextrinicus TaxID=51664 RepID=UPI003F223B2D